MDLNQCIKIEGLSCGYRQNQVIKDISFDISRGEFLGIIGPNGAGKSTLLKSLSRSLKPSAGKVFYQGKDIYSLPLKKIARNFAFVSQSEIFNFSFTVNEVVLMGRTPYLRNMQKESLFDLKIAEEAMRLTDTLGLGERDINTLSAGERQMVIIAQALTQEPEVLFLDEPTAHLDIGHQVKILNLVRELNQKKKITVICVLHDLNLASEYCRSLVLLNDGRVFKKGSVKEVLDYRTIEEVYKTLVLVKENPLTKNPHVLLIGKPSQERIDDKG
ncbi:MAG: ABC transporter ATP-binding protein [Candidatus Omnitrophica bacterium]|nr:ABC transporter ATP-binding protein [Candidatus Omnitrophota bacterium]